MTDVSLPWSSGAATGIGSLPGTDIVEAQRVVLGELPDLPHLAELPARGAGADMLGRGAALLAELPVELYAARWRVAARAGHDLRVARDFLERDLDTLTDQAAEYAGPVKAQAVGPWTLAASLELPSGGVLLRDQGAVRDLAASLAQGVRDHVAQLRARLPRASVVLQLDEPSLPAVLAGRVPTESGLGTLRSVEPSVARAALNTVIEAAVAAGAPVVVHCCASGAPLAMIREAGAIGVAVDLTRFESARDLDALAAVVDAGLGIFAGAVDTRHPASGRSSGGAGRLPGGAGRSSGGAGRLPGGAGRSSGGAGRPPSGADVAAQVRGLWRRLGFPLDRLATQVVVTPACGLAGASEGWARAAMTACRDAARRLSEPD